jgi:hypothetical protein
MCFCIYACHELYLLCFNLNSNQGALFLIKIKKKIQHFFIKILYRFKVKSLVCLTYPPPGAGFWVCLWVICGGYLLRTIPKCRVCKGGGWGGIFHPEVKKKNQSTDQPTVTD